MMKKTLRYRSKFGTGLFAGSGILRGGAGSFSSRGGGGGGGDDNNNNNSSSSSSGKTSSAALSSSPQSSSAAASSALISSSSTSSSLSSPSLKGTRGGKVGRNMTRQLLKHQALYDDQLRPLLQALPKHTYQLCRFFGSRQLREVQTGPNGDFPKMLDAIRDRSGDTEIGLEGLRMLNLLSQRLAVTNHRSLTDVPYTLQVGDVVRHTQFGHLGVIAAQIPVCLESDEWILNNLGSLTDSRLAHPWYLILVGCHPGLPIDFVRYGSQLTHRKLETGKPIGFHRLLPMYFKGYDHERGRYIPRGEKMPEQNTMMDDPHSRQQQEQEFEPLKGISSDDGVNPLPGHGGDDNGPSAPSSSQEFAARSSR